MYRHYFGIDEKPFSITPDPRYLLLTHGHEEALAHLLYGIGEGGGFVLLTGEVGTGKTVICRRLLEQVDAGVHIALVLNPHLSELDLVAVICDELGVFYPAVTTSVKELMDRLNKHLLALHARGERAVVLIDEAQNLTPLVMEELRLLTNLETEKQKLLQIILVGQPELNDLLGRRDLRQVAQRITARYHLKPLKAKETRAYIAHRLRVAGLEASLFPARVTSLIHELSGGIPRLINLICDRSMLGAYVAERKVIDRALVRRAAQEVFGAGTESPATDQPGRGLRAAAFVALVLAVLIGGMVFARSPWVDSWFGEDRKLVITMPSIELVEGQKGPAISIEPTSPQVAPVPAGEAERADIELTGSESVGPEANEPAVDLGQTDWLPSEVQESAGSIPPVAALTTEAGERAEGGVRQTLAPAPESPPSDPGASALDSTVSEPAAVAIMAPERATGKKTIEDNAVGDDAIGDEALQQAALQEEAVTQSTPAVATDLGDALRATTVDGSRAAAIRRLFALWGTADPPSGEAVCEPARNDGHACLWGDDGWAGLDTFGKPAMIVLRNPRGGTLAALLVSLDEKMAGLMLDDEEILVSRQALDRFWSGDYLVLWRAPEPWERLLRKGGTGDDVLWLRQALAKTLDRAIGEPGSPFFGEALHEAVMAFQRDLGLEPDGIVGPRTMILLTQAVGEDEGPRLRAQ